MNFGSTPGLPAPRAADPAVGRTFPARIWIRIPVVVRAVVVGLCVLVGGNFLPKD